MLATLSIAFTERSDASDVLPPDDKEHVANVLEDDAEVMSDTQVGELVADEPPDVRDEILSINDDSRDLALQVALALPLIASLMGFAASFRMVRLPDPEAADGGAAAFG
jgi:hypothetical protein